MGNPDPAKSPKTVVSSMVGSIANTQEVQCMCMCVCGGRVCMCVCGVCVYVFDFELCTHYVY